MKKSDDSILGCFVSGPASYHDDVPETREVLVRKGELFRNFVWGSNGICDSLKVLKNRDYGNDLDLILLKFYLLPLIEELAVLKEIERFRKKEKAIGVPIIVHDDNFFNRSELERLGFVKAVILEKLDILKAIVKRNKMDTNVNRLRDDVKSTLS
jgi:hypothetical protein